MTRARAGASVAVLAALSFLLITLTAAGPAGAASSGGVGISEPSAPDSGAGNRELAKYSRLWEQVSYRDRRWARETAECESGGDPDALGYGGRYRGAFQFMRSTWKTAPKSPGGDPIDYPYKTQAVVAIALRKRDGAGHWPVCG
jgi:hypothetical protein